MKRRAIDDIPTHLAQATMAAPAVKPAAPSSTTATRPPTTVWCWF